MPSTTIADRKTEILKRLRKREQKSMHDVAEEIGYGCTVKHLTRAVAELVTEGAAVRHKGRPPLYTKA